MLPLLSFIRKVLLLGKHKLQQHSPYHDQVRHLLALVLLLQISKSFKELLLQASVS